MIPNFPSCVLNPMRVPPDQPEPSEKYMSDDAVEGLDVSLLQDYVLDPIFGIKNPKTDNRLTWCQKHIEHYGDKKQKNNRSHTSYNKCKRHFGKFNHCR